jgi:hypothetical protein
LRLVVGRCLVVGRGLVVGLLLVGLLILVVSNRRSGNERPPPCPSPETHGELLPVRSADLRFPEQGASIVVSPAGATIRTSHAAAPGRCSHHPGITPEGVIAVIVITAR